MDEVSGLAALLKMIEERIGKRLTTGIIYIVAAAIAVFFGGIVWNGLIDPIWNEGAERGWWDDVPESAELALRLVLAIALTATGAWALGMSIALVWSRFLPTPIAKQLRVERARVSELEREIQRLRESNISGDPESQLLRESRNNTNPRDDFGETLAQEVRLAWVDDLVKSEHDPSQHLIRIERVDFDFRHLADSRPYFDVNLRIISRSVFSARVNRVLEGGLIWKGTGFAAAPQLRCDQAPPTGPIDIPARGELPITLRQRLAADEKMAFIDFARQANPAELISLGAEELRVPIEKIVPGDQSDIQADLWIPKNIVGEFPFEKYRVKVTVQDSRADWTRTPERDAISVQLDIAIDIPHPPVEINGATLTIDSFSAATSSTMPIRVTGHKEVELLFFVELLLSSGAPLRDPQQHFHPTLKLDCEGVWCSYPIDLFVHLEPA